MDEEKRVSDLLSESVKPEAFFAYPDYIEKSENIELIRRSCQYANTMKAHYCDYLSIEEMLEEKVPPVAVTMMLGGVAYMFEWFGKLFLPVCLYLGTISALLMNAFLGASRRNEFYFWLRSKFPENLLILIGLPLLLIYVAGVLVCIKRDLNDAREDRKAVTTDRAKWIARMEKDKAEIARLQKQIQDMEPLGGMPYQLWMESGRIWEYFLDHSADTLREALTLLKKEKRAESFGKENSILENMLALKILQIDRQIMRR